MTSQCLNGRDSLVERCRNRAFSNALTRSFVSNTSNALVLDDIITRVSLILTGIVCFSCRNFVAGGFSETLSVGVSAISGLEILLELLADCMFWWCLMSLSSDSMSSAKFIFFEIEGDLSAQVAFEMLYEVKAG